MGPHRPTPRSATATGRVGVRTELLRQMLRIRRFGERQAERTKKPLPAGSRDVGDEAVAVGAASVLREGDAFVSCYHHAGHALARGLPMGKVVATVRRWARGDRGLLEDTDHRFHSDDSAGGGMAVAVGLALADAAEGKDAVTVCLFTAAATSEAQFHETMNLAAMWGTPVVFCCETNLDDTRLAVPYAHVTPDLVARARSYGLVAWPPVDGMDVLAVRAATTRAVEVARSGGGPCFLEFRTYRPSWVDPAGWARPRRWEELDPIGMLVARMRSEDGLLDSDLDMVERDVIQEMNRWDTPNADRCPSSGPDTWSGGEARRIEATTAAPMTTVTYREAVRLGLREALARDERVVLMGAPRDTGAGLLAHFGPRRVLATPPTEAAFAVAAVGAAMAGLHPIVEVHTAHGHALVQVLDELAAVLPAAGGRSLPLVVRVVVDGSVRQGSPRAPASVGIPGLRVVAPATPGDARGMLVAAAAGGHPVLIVEDTTLRDVRGSLDGEAGQVALDRAAVRRPGADVTVLAYGAMLHPGLASAEKLAGRGVDAEVVDPRTLVPLDEMTILSSVRRTGRVVVAGSDDRWSAQTSAWLGEQAFEHLRGPVERARPSERAKPPERSKVAERWLDAGPATPAVVAAALRAMNSRR